MQFKPFKQGRFKDLPVKPRRHHLFFETEAIDLQLQSKCFGPMKVHVRKYGKGPALLLIHGFMTTSYSWRYAFEELGKHYTCYAIDLPGAGRTEPALLGSYAPSDLAAWLAEVIRELDIFGCPIIGNSMGGYLAMHLALQEPQAMSCLLNLHSPGIPELRLQLLDSALSIPGSRGFLKWVVQRDPMKFVHKNVHYYDESLKSLEEAEEYSRTLKTQDGALALVKYFDETMNISHMRNFGRTLRDLKHFPVPLLLLYAKNDPMVSPKFGKEFKKLIPNAELKYIDKGSHFAHVDGVEEFMGSALPFLDRVKCR
jgi:pimeloyl-ACP methyl ester carboxylesterase